MRRARSTHRRETGGLRAVLLSALVLSTLLLSTVRTSGQEPGSNPLARDIELAIEKGARWLRRSVSDHKPGPIERGYPLGTRALVAYTLLESGIDDADPFIEKLFTEMATEELRQVYGVSLYVLALHAWQQRVRPVVRERPGKTEVASHVLPGGQSVEDEIARCVDWLVDARFIGQGTWGYGSLGRARKDPWTDFSNTQFAALALHVGVLHGIDVPTKVFEEMVATFSGSALAGPEELEITVDRATWRDRDKKSSGRVTVSQRPISWGYRPIDPRARRKRDTGWGTLSMTSAAVSTMLVANHALEERDRRSRKVERAIDTLVTGGIVELSRAWRPMRERFPGSMHRNIYYTLYSFEKAMDLAGIAVLDGTDWYRTQVPLLLREQDPKGYWGARNGTVELEYRHMATCFALLFLRRATASLTVQEAAPIVTHGESAASGVSSGRVLVPSLGGTIDLEELFRRLLEEPSRELVGIAEEAVQAVPPEDRHQLLRWLMPLASAGGRERVGAFARRTIAAITGLPERSERAQVERWWERWRRVEELNALADPAAAAEIGPWLSDPSLGVPLRIEGITALRRIGTLDAMPFLLDALEDGEAEVRGAAFRAVRDLTRAELAFDPMGEKEERAEQVAAWRYWWDARGEELRLERDFAALRDRLERAEDPDERTKVRDALTALGPEIVPRVERIIAEGSYAFDWLLIRQALTGETGVP